MPVPFKKKRILKIPDNRDALRREQFESIKCGDANPNANIQLTYKGGCRKELKILEAYRCAGCGGYFHKDCLLEHFKIEKKHDWGRQEERKEIGEKIRKIIKENDTEIEIINDMLGYSKILCQKKSQKKK